MNRNIQNFIDKYQFTEIEKFHCGTIDNYQVFIKYDAFAVPAFIGGVCANLTKYKTEISQYLNEHKKELKLVNFEIHDYYVYFAVICFTTKSAVQNMENALLQFTAYLKTLGVLDSLYCPICGQLMQDKVLSMSFEVPMYIDSSCQSVAMQKQQESIEEFNAAPNNYLKGTLGAIIGGLIGCVLWIFLGVVLNILVGYVAFLISYLAGMLYDKMQGKQTWVKILIISIITLVGIVASTFITYIVITSQEMAKAGIEGSSLRMLIKLIQADSEVRGEFITNMVLGVVFGVLGIVFIYLQYKKSIRHGK